MLRKDNRGKILELFFERPTSEFQLRQISRLVRIAPPSTKRYLQELEREGFVKKLVKNLYPVYRAERDSLLFKNLKKWSLVVELVSNGFSDCVVDACGPDAVVLFGSASRGEDVESSDVDVAVFAQEVVLDLEKFERRIGRKISFLFVPSFGDLSDELKNNIINGVILYGYVEVF